MTIIIMVIKNQYPLRLELFIFLGDVWLRGAEEREAVHSCASTAAALRRFFAGGWAAAGTAGTWGSAAAAGATGAAAAAASGSAEWFFMTGSGCL